MKLAIGLIVILCLSLFGSTSIHGASTCKGDAKPIDLNYTITGGAVDLMCLDWGVILVFINATEKGTVAIEVPREVFDPRRYDCTDDAFFVLLNGQEALSKNIRSSGLYYDEKRDSNSRTFTIPFESGAKEIELIAYSGVMDQKTGKDCPTKVLSPYQQIANGVSPENVACKEGLQLIFKSKDNSPACVKPQTAQKLVQRGWGSLTLVEKTISVSNTNYTIHYIMTEGKLTKILYDEEGGVMILLLESTNDGQITIKLPKPVDSKPPPYFEFYVLVDGAETRFEQEVAPTERIMTIKFPKGAEEIEVIGTGDCKGMPCSRPFLGLY